MSIEHNVKVVTANGDECFICEQSLDQGKLGIQISINVPVILATVNVKRTMHKNCAESLYGLLGLRLTEIYNHERRTP